MSDNHRTLGLARVPSDNTDYADVMDGLADDEPDGHFDLTGRWPAIGANNYGAMTGSVDQGIK